MMGKSDNTKQTINIRHSFITVFMLYYYIISISRKRKQLLLQITIVSTYINRGRVSAYTKKTVILKYIKQVLQLSL